MKFTILSAEEKQIYRSLDDQPYITTIKFKTEKGYTGQVEIERKGLTKEGILEAVRKEIGPIEEVLKTSHNL